METKMETLGPLKGIYRVIQGTILLVLYWDNGKENGNVILGEWKIRWKLLWLV